MGDECIFVSPLDWWPQTLEEGQVLMALKSVYGTKQAPHCSHERVSKWMYAWCSSSLSAPSWVSTTQQCSQLLDFMYRLFGKLGLQVQLLYLGSERLDFLTA